MKVRNRLIAAGTVVATAAACLAGSGTAAAAFPNFSDCPRTTPNVVSCVNIQARSGSLNIKGFNVPLGESLEIRGGVASTDAGLTFVAPRGTNGFFARPVSVPGGIIGLDLPIPGNAVSATAALAGRPSDIHIDLATLTLRVPVKLLLSNPLIGPACRIGNDDNPVRLNLIIGTTNPPAPNRPITGRMGAINVTDRYISFIGNTNVDNSFSIPGASYCGLGLGLFNLAINAKLRLPSASGNNTMIVNNDVAVGAAGL
jgi:hypothetical protein